MIESTIDCGDSVEMTPLQRKQAEMRGRIQKPKLRTRLGHDLDTCIVRTLKELDGSTRAEIREKLGSALLAAIVYDDGVILDPATTPRQKRECADTLYKLFLNLAKAEADIVESRTASTLAKTKRIEARAALTRAIADKNKQDNEIYRRRKRYAKALAKPVKSEETQ